MINPKHNHILVISSYPPRECGIATYSQDLINVINSKFKSSFAIDVCALEEADIKREYPPEVKYRLYAGEQENYREMAAKINADPDIKDVFIQHEFGLFGGEYGKYLMILIKHLIKPVIVTFHTVLPGPDPMRKLIVKDISEAASNIIVMTNNSKALLIQDYGVDSQKISVIPHGAHLVCFNDRDELKAKYDLSGKMVLSTFGLLGPNKSIETAIEALPAIIKKFPDVVYLVLGKTHPGVVRHEGEKYRGYLESRVKELGISDHVRFENRYLSLQEILAYLRLTDIYLFTSRDPHQAVSGTFSYAMSCGCPILSTPIPHAKELLDEGTGIFFDFQDSNDLAHHAIELIKDKTRRENMSLNAIHKTNPMIWENVAIKHAKILNKTSDLLSYDLPDISLKHVRRLTDEFGMIQFSQLSVPDIDSGYTLDDNARAMIAMLMHYDMSRSLSDLDMIEKYLGFIEHCQQPNGKFFNYVDESKGFHIQNHYIHLDDSNARALWALGLLISYGDILPKKLAIRAKAAFDRSFGWVSELEYLRSVSIAIKGLYYYNLKYPTQEIADMVRVLANKLTKKFKTVSDEKWLWFEEHMSYANSIMPEAILYAYVITGEQQYRDVAKESFDFLLSHIFTGNMISVVSNKGWFDKGKDKNQYGEQPIEISYTIQALQVFDDVFGNHTYRDKLDIAFSWFVGNNHLGRTIYNPVSGGCYDGLEENSVNLNQGAESTVCYLIARLIMEKNKENRLIRKENIVLKYDSKIMSGVYKTEY